MAIESTPEEKLLRLIRRNERRGTVKPFVDAGGGMAAVEPARPRKKSSSNVLSFHFLNWLLIIVCGALVVYILLEFLSARNEPARIAASRESKTEEKHTAAEDYKIKPYSYYSAQFEQRDIFGAVHSQSNAAVPIAASTGTQQSLQDLRLVGVIMDNNPQAIIESKAENKTYFLHQGEMLKDFRVEVINESKVILSYGEEKFELSL